MRIHTTMVTGPTILDCGHMAYPGDQVLEIEPVEEEPGHAGVCSRPHCSMLFLHAVKRAIRVSPQALDEADRAASEALAIESDRRPGFLAAIAWAKSIEAAFPIREE